MVSQDAIINSVTISGSAGLRRDVSFAIGRMRRGEVVDTGGDEVAAIKRGAKAIPIVLDVQEEVDQAADGGALWRVRDVAPSRKDHF